MQIISETRWNKGISRPSVWEKRIYIPCFPSRGGTNAAIPKIHQTSPWQNCSQNCLQREDIYSAICKNNSTIYIYIHTLYSEYVSIHIYKNQRTHEYKRTHTCIYINTHMYVYIYIYDICIYVYTNICIYNTVNYKAGSLSSFSLDPKSGVWTGKAQGLYEKYFEWFRP